MINIFAAVIVLGLSVAAGMVFLACVVAYFCFDDTDPDQYPADNYTVVHCPHTNQSTVVHQTATTCEEVCIHCDDCGDILSCHLEC